MLRTQKRVQSEVEADLKLASLLVLGQVTVRLEGGVGRQPHILEVLLGNGLLPEGQPGDCLVMPHLLPLLSRVGVLGDGLLLACMDTTHLAHHEGD